MSERCRVITEEQYRDYLRLKKQLTEANNIIVKADCDCDYTLQKKCGFSDYLVKYGIEGIKNE